MMIRDSGLLFGATLYTDIKR